MILDSLDRLRYKGCMNREEELQRLYDDRDMLETDVDLLNEELKQYDEDSDDYENLVNEITHMENEAIYLTACIDSIEGGFED